MQFVRQGALTMTGSIATHNDSSSHQRHSTTLAAAAFDDGDVNHSTPLQNDDVMNATSTPNYLVEWLRTVDGSSAAITYGYMSAVLFLVTLVTNCLVCIVLLKRHMRGSPTNILLIALSISTTLTGVWPLPCIVYYYVFGAFADWIPCHWVIANDFLVDYLPTIFHTSSIWLTVALAVQRYIIVCHAKTTAANQWRNVTNVVRISVGVLVVSFLPHFIRFFEQTYQPVSYPSQLNNSVNVSACAVKYIGFVANNDDIYFSIYYFIRVVFINCLPCLVLVLVNAALINTMKTAEARRKILLKYNRRSECRRLAESNATTLMLVTVVGVFLLVEFPMAILFIWLIFDNILEIRMINPTTSATASQVVNLLIQFSYPINFFIYCAMSRQFRDTFKSLFVCCEQSKSKTTIEEPPTRNHETEHTMADTKA